MQNTTPTTQFFWDGKQTSQAIGCCERTLQNLVAQGLIPSIKLGRLRKYDPEAVREAIK